MSVKKITVGNCQFNVKQASAVDQFDLISVLGPLPVMESIKAGKDIDANMVLGCLLACGKDRLAQVKGIVFDGNVTKNGEERLLDIGDFAGQMGVYLPLLAECVIHNLGDFFGYLSSASKEESSGAGQ